MATAQDGVKFFSRNFKTFEDLSLRPTISTSWFVLPDLDNIKEIESKGKVQNMCS